jgi:hypothetical protein
VAPKDAKGISADSAVTARKSAVPRAEVLSGAIGALGCSRVLNSRPVRHLDILAVHQVHVGHGLLALHV